MASDNSKITQAELAKLAGVPRQAVFKAIQAGKIPIDKKSRKVIFDDPATQLWLDEKLVESGKQGAQPSTPPPAPAASKKKKGGKSKTTAEKPTASSIPGTARSLAQIKIEEEINRIKAETRLKELKYAKERGDLIEKDRLGAVLFKYLDALNNNMLDVPDMIIDMVIDMVKSKTARGKIIKYMRDTIQGEIVNTKKQINNRLK